MKTRLTLIAAVVAASMVAGPAHGFFGWFKKKETPAEQTAEGATTAAPAAVAQAQAGQTLSQAALDTAKSVSTALASIASNGEQLKSALGGNEQLQQLLDKALESAKLGDGVAALKRINELGEKAKLTDSQRGLVDKLKKDFEILALGRSFPEGGPVTDAIGLLQSGDTTKAVALLTSTLKDSNLSDEQRTVLKTVIEEHAGDFKRLLSF